MISILFSRLCILTWGILYPAYISFKTVRAKNIDDYINWMMYWIVFAIFTLIEALSDIFFTWLPFYYECKVIFILWLLPTTANGSSFIYKHCTHPLLEKHERQIDYHLRHIFEKGYKLILEYLKEAGLLVGRHLMDMINKNFSNGALSLLSNNNLSNRSIQNSQNIIIEEIEMQQITKKVRNARRGSASRSKEAEIAQGRSRRTRQNKKEIA